MTETNVEIPTSDGIAGGILFHDDRTRLPGVIHLTDIAGIRPSQAQGARRLAEQGYTVLLPNIFYRTGKPPLADFPIKPGPETDKRLAQLRGPLTPDAIARDSATYVDYLTSQPSVAEGTIAVVGYCYSGAFAIRIAAARPEKVAAVATFHAGRLFTDAPDSPHLLLPKIKARLYFGHAVQDKSMPSEAIEKFELALKDWGGVFKSETYEGAFHSWTTLDSPVYNKPQAERAFSKLLHLLTGTLGHSE